MQTAVTELQGGPAAPRAGSGRHSHWPLTSQSPSASPRVPNSSAGPPRAGGAGSQLRATRHQRAPVALLSRVAGACFLPCCREAGVSGTSQVCLPLGHDPPPPPQLVLLSCWRRARQDSAACTKAGGKELSQEDGVPPTARRGWKPQQGPSSRPRRENTPWVPFLLLGRLRVRPVPLCSARLLSASVLLPRLPQASPSFPRPQPCLGTAPRGLVKRRDWGLFLFLVLGGIW